MIKDDRDFSALGIAAKRVNKLFQEGIIVPTEVQEKVIPDIISNKNLIVQSPTGTGKTLAYLLPLLERIDQSTKDLEVLVLVPSRELAFQVVRVIQKFADDLGVVALTGGANGVRQLEGLKEKPKIVVGTPGRVLGSFNKKKLNGQVIKTIVVDEVDKMLSAGFMGDVFSIFQKTLKSRQVLMFSATIPKNLLNEASEIIDQPISIMFKDSGITPATIEHKYLMCDKFKKITTIHKLLNILQPHKAMIFITRNEGVMPLAGKLREMGHNIEGLHSDLPQVRRKNIINGFRQEKFPIIVTTDLLARGMDLEGIEYIFNYDIPGDTKFYIHRAGRTGRAGKAGTVITLVSEQQKFFLYKIARDLSVDLEEVGIDEQKIFPVKYRKKKE